MVPAPVAGLRDHVSEVLRLFDTVAVNCWACEATSVTACGLTEIETEDSRLTVAVPDLAGSLWLVAVTVTACGVTLAGAVYRPAAVMAPTPAGFNDQFTAVFVALVTV